MPVVRTIIATLKNEETKLARELGKIRSAISMLEFGSGGGAPAEAAIRGRRRRRGPVPRKAGARRKRTVSAAQRKAQSLKMKAYWAQRKAGAKK